MIGADRFAISVIDSDVNLSATVASVEDSQTIMACHLWFGACAFNGDVSFGDNPCCMSSMHARASCSLLRYAISRSGMV